MLLAVCSIILSPSVTVDRVWAAGQGECGLAGHFQEVACGCCTKDEGALGSRDVWGLQPAPPMYSNSTITNVKKGAEACSICRLPDEVQ